MIQQQSVMAHQYLDGLYGIEIGGSAANSFGLKTLNVDYCSDMDTVFKAEEVRLAGRAMPVDVVACGDRLPFRNDSLDFVVTSHVVEHFFDPIRALDEWQRVVRAGGLIFIIAPHKERTFDREKPRTSVGELLARHSGEIPPPETDLHKHYSVWITEDLIDLCLECKYTIVDLLDTDDKVGNGFTIVLRKPGHLQSQPQYVVHPFNFAIAAAVAQHQAGNVVAAEKMYMQVLAAAPHHADAVHLAGLTAWQLGRASEGMQRVRTAIALNGGEANYHLNLAKMANANGQLEDALLGFEQAAALNPTLADAHFHAGLLHAQSGNVNQALTKYERTLALLRPDFASALAKRQAAAQHESEATQSAELAKSLGAAV